MTNSDLTRLIKPNLFFSIKYQTKDGEIKDYTLRTGVMEWKEADGNKNCVKGTGKPIANPELYLKAYCTQRMCYRTFIIENIIELKQGEVNLILNNQIQTI